MPSELGPGTHSEPLSRTGASSPSAGPGSLQAHAGDRERERTRCRRLPHLAGPRAALAMTLRRWLYIVNEDGKEVARQSQRHHAPGRRLARDLRSGERAHPGRSRRSSRALLTAVGLSGFPVFLLLACRGKPQVIAPRRRAHQPVRGRSLAQGNQGHLPMRPLVDLRSAWALVAARAPWLGHAAESDEAAPRLKGMSRGVGQRVRPARVEPVSEIGKIVLKLPDEREWKRALSRFF